MRDIPAGYELVEQGIPAGYELVTPEPAQPAAAPEEPGFYGKIQEQMRQRGANLADLTAAKESGERFGIEVGYERIGEEAGAIGDVVGQAVSSAAQTGFEALPDIDQDALKLIGTDILQSEAGQLGIQALQKGGEMWGGFEKEHPRTADLIRATVNIGTLGFAGATKPVQAVTKGGGKALMSGAKAVTQKKVQPSGTPAEQMKAYSSSLYQQVDEIGANTKPEATNAFIKELESLKPRSEKAKILAGNRLADEYIDKFKEFEGQSITLAEADEMDKILGDEVTKHYTVKGLDADGHSILKIQEKFREHITDPKSEMIEGGAEGYKLRLEAAETWSKHKLLEDIETIETNADLTDIPATARKSGYRAIIRNKKRFNRYNAKEKALIKRGAKGGKVANLLRTTIGSRLLSTIVGSTGGVGGVAAAAGLSATARAIADKSGAGVTKALQQEIIGRQSKIKTRPVVSEETPPKKTPADLSGLRYNEVMQKYLSDELGVEDIDYLLTKEDLPGIDQILNNKFVVEITAAKAGTTPEQLRKKLLDAKKIIKKSK